MQRYLTVRGVKLAVFARFDGCSLLGVKEVKARQLVTGLHCTGAGKILVISSHNLMGVV